MENVQKFHFKFHWLQKKEAQNFPSLQNQFFICHFQALVKVGLAVWSWEERREKEGITRKKVCTVLPC